MKRNNPVGFPIRRVSVQLCSPPKIDSAKINNRVSFCYSAKQKKKNRSLNPSIVCQIAEKNLKVQESSINLFEGSKISNQIQDIKNKKYLSFKQSASSFYPKNHKKVHLVKNTTGKLPNKKHLTDGFHQKQSATVLKNNDNSMLKTRYQILKNKKSVIRQKTIPATLQQNDFLNQNILYQSNLLNEAVQKQIQKSHDVVSLQSAEEQKKLLENFEEAGKICKSNINIKEKLKKNLNQQGRKKLKSERCEKNYTCKQHIRDTYQVNMINLSEIIGEYKTQSKYHSPVCKKISDHNQIRFYQHCIKNIQESKKHSETLKRKTEGQISDSVNNQLLIAQYIEKKLGKNVIFCHKIQEKQSILKKISEDKNICDNGIKGIAFSENSKADKNSWKQKSFYHYKPEKKNRCLTKAKKKYDEDNYTMEGWQSNHREVQIFQYDSNN